MYQKFSVVLLLSALTPSAIATYCFMGPILQGNASSTNGSMYFYTADSILPGGGTSAFCGSATHACTTAGSGCTNAGLIKGSEALSLPGLSAGNNCTTLQALINTGYDGSAYSHLECCTGDGCNKPAIDRPYLECYNTFSESLGIALILDPTPLTKCLKQSYDCSTLTQNSAGNITSPYGCNSTQIAAKTIINNYFFGETACDPYVAAGGVCCNTTLCNGNFSLGDPMVTVKIPTSGAPVKMIEKSVFWVIFLSLVFLGF